MVSHKTYFLDTWQPNDYHEATFLSSHQEEHGEGYPSVDGDGFGETGHIQVQGS